MKKLLLSGSFWGSLGTLAGAMMGPPVLAVLPTKWAGVMIVVGTIVTALSRSLPDVLKEIISNDSVADG
jgi:hypothetical protein